MAPEMEDREVVEFCRRVQPRLVGVLALHCGQRELGEDLAQETLVRVWEHWPEVSQLAAPEAWAYRVGLNLSTSALRRRMIERRRHPRPRTAEPDTLDRPDASEVRRALAALPPRQRSAVLLRFFADLPVEQTAAVMGCAPGTVKALTSQAISQLRTHPLLTPEGACDHG